LAKVRIYPWLFGITGTKERVLAAEIKATKIVMRGGREVDIPVIEAFVEASGTYPVEIEMTYDELKELYNQIGKLLAKGETERVVCPHCKCSNATYKGYKYRSPVDNIVVIYQCNECGGWFFIEKPIKRGVIE